MTSCCSRDEARYWIAARLDRTHCALCEITHGLVTERADWQRCREQLDVGFRVHHRPDAPEGVLAVGSPASFVVTRTDHGLVALLGHEDLDVYFGDVEDPLGSEPGRVPSETSTGSEGRGDIRRSDGCEVACRAVARWPVGLWRTGPGRAGPETRWVFVSFRRVNRWRNDCVDSFSPRIGGECPNIDNL